MQVNIKELKRAVELNVGDTIRFSSNSSAIGKIDSIVHQPDLDILSFLKDDNNYIIVDDDWNTYGRFVITWSEGVPDHMHRIKTVDGRFIRKLFSHK